MIKVILIICFLFLGCSKKEDTQKPNPNENKERVQKEDKFEWGSTASNGLQMCVWNDKNLLYCLVRNGTDHSIEYTAGAGGIGWWESMKVLARNIGAKTWTELSFTPSQKPLVYYGNISSDQRRTLEPKERIIGKKRFGKRNDDAYELTTDKDEPCTFIINLAEYNFPKDMDYKVELKVINSDIESQVLFFQPDSIK